MPLPPLKTNEEVVPPESAIANVGSVDPDTVAVTVSNTGRVLYPTLFVVLSQTKTFVEEALSGALISKAAAFTVVDETDRAVLLPLPS